MTQVKTKSKYRGPAPDPAPKVLVELPANYVPYVLLSLEEWKLPFYWDTPEDAAIANQALTTFGEGLLTDMTTSIVQAIDRVYMAIRQQSAGEVFTALPGDLPPELPTVPPALSADTAAGLLALTFAQQGILPGGWFGFGARPATYADIVQALRAGEESELDQMLSKIDLLGDVSDVAGIYNVVKGTATDLAELAEGGGTLATLVVSTLAQAAAAGLLQGSIDSLLAKTDSLLSKLDRLIASTDGGNEPRPDGNLLSVAETTRDLLTPDVGS